MTMQVKNVFANRLLKGVEFLSAAGAALSGLTFVLMVLLILAEVFLRTFMEKSTLIASEYSGYALATMIYLGLGFTFKEGAHIRITFLGDRLKGLCRHILEICCTCVAGALCAMSSVFLWDMVVVSQKRGAVAYTVAETPLWIPQAIILVGMVIMTLQVFAYLVYLLVYGPGAVEANSVKI